MTPTTLAVFAASAGFFCGLALLIVRKGDAERIATHCAREAVIADRRTIQRAIIDSALHLKANGRTKESKVVSEMAKLLRDRDLELSVKVGLTSLLPQPKKGKLNAPQAQPQAQQPA